MVLWVLLALASVASAADPRGPDPAIGAAKLVQQVLPDLRARLEAARARVDAAEGYFGGRSSLGAAFPDLAGRPILDPVVLAAEREALARRSRERAIERVLPPSPELSLADANRWSAARDAALDAEDTADLHRQRLVAALEAGLARAPGLSEPAVAQMLDPLRTVRDTARTALEASAAAGETVPPDALTTAAVAASAEQRIGELRTLCIDAMAVPGARGCAEQSRELAANLAASTAGDPARALAEMQRAVLPLLDGDDHTAVGANVRAWDLQRLAADEFDLERRLLEVRQTPAAAQGSAGEVGPPPEPTGDPELDAARARVHALRSELAEVEVAAGAAIARTALSADEEQAQLAAQANAEAEAARKEAALARGRAHDETRDREVAIREATATVLEGRALRHDAARARLTVLRADLEARTARAAAADALPPLDPARPTDLDGAYLAVRESVQAARQELAQLRAERLALLDDNRRIEADPLLAGGAGSLVNARAALEAALDARVTDADAELRTSVEVLHLAKEARRQLRPHASVAARSIARRTALVELADEVREIPLVLDMQIARARSSGVGLSRQALDVTAWWALLWLVAEIVAVFLLWRGARARLPTVVAELAERSARDEQAARWLGDPRNLVAEGTLLGQRLLDVIVIVIGLGWLGGNAPWLGIVLVAVLGRTVARASSHAVDVLLATPEEPRPAMWVVSHEDRERTRASVRLVVVWFFAEWVLGRIALGIFDGDRLGEVVDTLGCVAAVAIGTVLLAWWAPTVHRRLATDPDPDPVVRWVVTHAGPPGKPRSILTAALGVGVLVARAVLEGVRRRGGEGRFGWFGAALERRRLSGFTEPDRMDGPDPDLQARLAAVALPPPRALELAAVRSMFERWDEHRVRGLVAVSGDAGSGRSALLATFSRTVALPTSALTPPVRLLDPVLARRWLAGELGCGEADTEEETVGAIVDLPPRVVVVDDLHRLFLRTVGGYDALRAVLSVMQQTSHRHFWIVSFQGSAWALLEGLAQRVPLDAFGAVVKLAPLGPATLREWLVARASAAGLRLLWDRLAARTGSVTELAAERAENAWFRLLADASGGNARLSLEVFSAALRPTADGVVDVVLPVTPDARALECAPDAAHFLLAALLAHRCLDLPSLSLVLNLSIDAVRTVVLNLAADGVIEAEGGEWSVRSRWTPAVDRILRQRHFVQE